MSDARQHLQEQIDRARQRREAALNDPYAAPNYRQTESRSWENEIRRLQDELQTLADAEDLEKGARALCNARLAVRDAERLLLPAAPDLQWPFLTLNEQLDALIAHAERPASSTVSA